MFSLPMQTSGIAASDRTSIIADHTVVDQYDDIPLEYLASVKEMRLNIPGESHSEAYRTGLNALMLENPDYRVSITNYGPPESYRDDALRIDRLVYNSSSSDWDYLIGEAQWYTWQAWDDPLHPDYPLTNAAHIKEHLTYCDVTDPQYAINALGFGWCWDMCGTPAGDEDPVYAVHWAGSSVGGPDGSAIWGLDSGDYDLTGNSVCMDTYLQATEDYISHVTDIESDTTVFFTTGPVDGYENSEAGNQREIKHQYIRDYVNANGKVLFDYADILTHNDDGQPWTSSWNGHDYPQIHPDNLEGTPTGHIGTVGALRLGKALWWLLARLAGWNPDAEPDNEAPTVTVISPNGGEKFKQEYRYDIIWTASDNREVTTCNISYSIDGGSSFTPIVTGIGNTGRYTWTIPEDLSLTCYVMVMAADAAGNWGDDESDTSFEIAERIPGDANDDWVVSSSDIDREIQIILDQVAQPVLPHDADANDDEDINILDITCIERH